MSDLIICLGRDLSRMEPVITKLRARGWSVSSFSEPHDAMPLLMEQKVAGVIMHHGLDMDARALLPRYRKFIKTLPFFVFAGSERDKVAAAFANQKHAYVFSSPEELDLEEMEHQLRLAEDDAGMSDIPSPDAKLWDLLSHAVDWVFTTDKDGKITFTSSGTERLFGYGPSYIMGHRIWDLVPEIDRDDLREAWDKAVRNRAPLRDHHFKIISSDGNVVGLALHAVPSLETDGKFNGMVCVCIDETQRLAAFEMALAEEENYRSLIDSFPNPVIAINLEGRIMMVNGATRPLFGGLTPAQMVGLEIFRFLPEEERLKARRDIAMILRGEKEGPKRYHIIHPDGTVYLTEITSSVQYDGKGRVRRAVLVFRDITQEDRLQRELEEDRAKYQNIMESVPAVAFELDRDLCFTYVGANAERVWGFPPKEVLGTSPFDYLEIGERVRAISSLETIIFERQPFDGLVVRVKRPDGKTDHLEVGGRPYFDKNNVFQGYYGVARDVSKRVEIEKKLRKAESMYRLVAYNMNDDIWTTDMDLKVTYVSPSTRRKLRMHDDDDLEEGISKVSDAETKENMVRTMKGMVENARTNPNDDITRTMEIKIHSYDKGIRWAEQRLKVLKDIDGTPLGIICVSRDITEWKMVLQRLTNAEQAAWSLFERGPDAMFLIDPEVRPPAILMANEKAIRETGYTAEEFQGMPLGQLVMEVSPEDVEDWKRQIAEDVSIVVERPQRRKDGTFYDVQTNLSMVMLEGQPMLLALVRDISEERRNIRLLERRNRELVALNRLIQSCSYIDNEENLLRLTMDLISEIGDFNVCAVIMLDESGQPYITEGKGLDEKLVQHLNKEPSMLAEILEYMKDGEPLFMPDISSASDRAKDWGIESFASLPLMAERRVIGALVFTSTRSKELPMSDRHLLISVWHQVQETMNSLELRRQRDY